MKHLNDPEKESLKIMQKIRLLHPGNWSIKSKTKILFILSTVIGLIFIIIVAFAVQKRSSLRLADAHLSLYIDSRAGHLEDYFQSLANHLSTFTADSKTIEALNAFTTAFSGIEEDHYFTNNATGMDDINSLLRGFYTAEILPLLETKMNESLQPERFLPQDNRQKILQYLYLAENARPLTQKYTMNRASDGSLYSEYHSQFHPHMLAFARRIGISDLLLVDYKTGSVVYSLKKNIDFGTNLYGGPFRNSALAAAYMDAAGASGPGIVKYTDASFYIPYMMQPVVFISSPVFSGSQLLGTAIFALDISTFDRLLTTGANNESGTGNTIKTFLIGDDFTYRNNDPDFLNNAEAYLLDLKKHGNDADEYDNAERLETTALIQKVSFSAFQNAFDEKEGRVLYETATGEKAYCTFRVLENHSPNWILCGQITRSDLFAPVFRLFWFMVLASILLLIFIYFTARYYSSSIFRPVSRLKSALDNLKDGKTWEEIDTATRDELGQTSEAFNTLSRRLNEMLFFVSELGKENYDVKMESRDKDDQISKVLENLKGNLAKKQSEEVKRKNDEEIRNWSTHGITLFNDALRQDNDNVEKLSLNVVRNLIEYLKANQGGIFLLEGEEKGEQKLNLIAAIAFDKQKFMKKTIDIGEGLVGTCVLEKQTTLLNKVPDDYIEITSGLGGARPDSLLIVPLKKDDIVYGVIELASFNPFKPHEVKFIEKVAENIADTIINVRLNLQNVQLLERFRQQEEEMKAQDEELRQNIEELQATHEQMERMKAEEKEQNEKLIKEMEDNRKLLIDVLDKIPGKIFVKDHNGVLLLLNSEVARVYNRKVEELIGTSDFDNHPLEEAKEYRAKELEIMAKGGETYIQEEKLTGEMRYLKTTKMPFKIATTGETGLLGFQIDITDARKLEEQVAQLNAKLEQLHKKLAAKK
ncbi:MAG: GAF domain-containing protein [Bacteroidales bacterium]|nr:GAF domain-containing protein [Bacteroidales bacterium]